MAFEQAYEQVRQDIARNRGVDNPILLDDSFIFFRIGELLSLNFTLAQAQGMADKKWSAFAESVSLYPETGKSLQDLRKEFQLILCVDGCTKYELRVLEKLQLKSYFNSILISDTFGTSKTTKGFWSAVLRDLQCQANTILVVDDRPEVIAAASSLSIPTARIRRGKYQLVENRVTPFLEVSSLQDLVPILVDKAQVANIKYSTEEWRKIP